MSMFVMPSLGADMESAVLMEWHVKEGDHVTKGQIIAEVETSKGVIEIEVFEAGVIEKLLVEEETECAVGTPLALIHSVEESTDIPASEPLTVAPPTPKVEDPVASQLDTPSHSEPLCEPSHERPKISPAARHRAKELGIDLFTLARAGEVHLAQVEAAQPHPQEPRTPVCEAPSPIHEMPARQESGMRQAIARAMSRSNAEIPHYYLETSINMTPALRWLEEFNARRGIEDRILGAAVLIRATVKALQEVPELNGFWQSEGAILSEAIHPGIAIAKRKEGLITPALLGAQNLGLEETMRALSDLITRTRSGKLRGSEMTQQTITITNLGDLGVETVFGVIYPPQIALIGFGRIMDAPWAEGDTLSVRKVMKATLAGDHRATDGRTGALFLDRLNQLLQHPEELL